MIETPDLSKLDEFDWDQGNQNKNYEKHRVTQQEAEEIFANGPLIIFYDYQHSQQEKRFGVFGKTNRQRLLSIVFTIRNNKIRIITARDQNRKEEKNYAKTK